MTLSPITPETPPRQVIPFGDRAIVDPTTGKPTPEFYQWCNRMSGGLTTSITNISTTINETNNVVETVNNVTADVSTIEAEIAVIDNTLGVLQGEIAAVQFDAGNIPTPPPPSIPAAALVQKIEAPPPPPRLPPADPAPPLAPVVARAVDYVELEAGSGPTKISAMPDASLPTAGTEVFLLVQSNGNVKLVFPISGGAGSTVIVPISIGDTIQVQSADQVAAATPSQDVFLFTGGPGAGADTGAANVGTGNNPGSGNTGDAWLYSGDAAGGNSGNVHLAPGAAAGAGKKTGDIVITINVGTGGATNGNVLMQNLPTSSAGLPADAVWCDTGAANVLKKV